MIFSIFEGTVRESRTGGAKLEECKQMKKKDRGESDFCFDTQNEIAAVRWNDNSVVTVLSNCTLAIPMQQTKRYDRKKKKMINVPMPNAIKYYNKTMGGVDLFDNGVNNYRIRMRGKKWYWPLFTNALDSAMVNAWKIHCICSKVAHKKIMHQCDFRAFVIDCLLRKENASTISYKLGVKSARSCIRMDRVDHEIIRANKRRRCAKCKSQTIFTCKKCNVGLHPKCFEKYHS